MPSLSFIVLHFGDSVSLDTYLVRVLLYLLSFTGFCITVFVVVRVVERIRSPNQVTESGPRPD